MEKKFIKIDISKLKNYENNNKIHTDEDISEIVKSIEKCEYLSPILIDEKFEIINWHWRKEALLRLWYNEIDVIQVKWLTEIQKKKARLLDNKITDIAIYNLENIKIELEELDDVEIKDLFSDIIFEKVDYDDIYNGMPEFEQEDLTADYQIKVSFLTVQDIQDFGEKIGQKLTEKTRSIWFPAQGRADLQSEKIIDE